MADTYKDRLAMLQGGFVDNADPEITVGKIVMHNAKGDEVPLRTKPSVMAVFLKVRLCGAPRSPPPPLIPLSFPTTGCC